MPERPLLVAVLFALSALATLEPAAVEAEIAASVAGVAPGGEVSGTFTLQRFVSDGGRLLALGTLTDIAGPHATSGQMLETVRIAVTAVSRSCEALHLDFGPIDLDVQSRTVHVNDFAVHVADAGSGPLRNSLCAVANAPDDVNTLVPLLNELVDLVGCLMRGADGCSRQSI